MTFNKGKQNESWTDNRINGLALTEDGQCTKLKQPQYAEKDWAKRT